MSLGFRKEIQPTGDVWQKVSNSIDESDVTSLLIVSGEDSPVILVGTQQGVYRSVDDGKTFQPVLQLSSREKKINYLYTPDNTSEPEPAQEDSGSNSPALNLNHSKHFPFGVFAAANSGLFMSQDEGLRWEKIFSSADPLSQQCLSVVVDRDTVYLGTANGLFYKKGDSSSWQKRSDFLNPSSTDKVISSLARDNRYIYAATNHEVFRIDPSQENIQKIFSLVNRESESETPADPAESIEPSYKSQIKQIKVLDGMIPEIYLATTKGIFKSPDQGETWTNLSLDGLPSEAITSLTVLPDQEVCAGTQKGIFQYHDERWFPLYKGMETNQVNFLTLDDHFRIYAATDKGIFFYPIKTRITNLISTQ